MFTPALSLQLHAVLACAACLSSFNSMGSTAHLGQRLTRSIRRRENAVHDDDDHCPGRPRIRAGPRYAVAIGRAECCLFVGVMMFVNWCYALVTHSRILVSRRV